MKKRYLSIFLALAMVCGTAFPAMAAEYDPEVQALSEIETLSDYEEGIYDGADAGQEAGSYEEPEAVQEDAGEAQVEPAQETGTAGEDLMLTEPEDAQDEYPQERTDAQGDISPEDGIAGDESVQTGLGDDLNPEYVGEQEDIDEPEDAEEPEEAEDDEDGIALLAVSAEDEEEDYESDGFHQVPDGSDWYYYKNGEIDTSLTDIIEGTVNGQSGWWYVVSGKVQLSYTGVTNHSNSAGWWYVVNGKVDFSANTVASNNYGTWYVEGGKVNFSYTGFGKNDSGWWYIQGGKVSTSTNSVIQDTHKSIDGTSGWWYVVGGKVQTSYTGVVNYTNAYGWWYVKNGKVDFSANTVASNNYGTWYVEGGKVNFSYNGFAKDGSSWWYIQGGKVSTSTNSVIQDTHKSIDGTNGWWYVVGGQVQASYTGVVNYTNAYGWWYVKNGRVDFSYTGFGQNKNGWWYVDGGKVIFSKNSVIQDTHKSMDGTDGWWYVVGGQVQTSYTGVVNYTNSAGWWYVKNGKVDFSANTVASNNYGKWYVEGGKVQFTYNGFAKDGSSWWYIKNGEVNTSTSSVIQDTGKKIDGTDGWWYVVKGQVQDSYTGVVNYTNSAGWWYVKNGRVDFSFTGVADNDNGLWYVKDGKVSFGTTGTVTIGDNSYSVQNGRVQASMVVIDGKTYYYDNSGKKVTGWTAIGNGYYYFDRDTGAMAVNTTVDGIKLDSSGLASSASSDDTYKIKTMIKVRTKLQSLVNSSESKEEQLRKCFDYSAGLTSQRIRYFLQTKRNYPDTWMCIYVDDALDTGTGTCVTSACVFAFLAKELGYTNIEICDTNGHCWVEIDGIVYDPGMTVPGYYGKYYGHTADEIGYTYINAVGI